MFLFHFHEMMGRVNVIVSVFSVMVMRSVSMSGRRSIVILFCVNVWTYKCDPLRGIFLVSGSHGWFPSRRAASFQSWSVNMPPRRLCYGHGQLYIISL